MTYKELKAHIEVMDDEQLDQDVTVRDVNIDETFKILGIEFEEEDDVLDKNHPFLTFPADE